MRKINLIVLHCSATRENMEYSPEQLERGHRDLSPDRNGDGVITPDEWLKECPCFDAEEEYGWL